MKTDQKTNIKKIMKIQRNIYAIIKRKETIIITKMKLQNITKKEKKIQEIINIFNIIKKIQEIKKISK
jgi:hypothetical protein